ncbi:MAG: hypothetical protein PWP31_818 [Clostridia bacterium]|nr:hypothetical protein [Clostridia bacterium]
MLLKAAATMIKIFMKVSIRQDLRLLKQVIVTTGEISDSSEELSAAAEEINAQPRDRQNWRKG